MTCLRFTLAALGLGLTAGGCGNPSDDRHGKAAGADGNPAFAVPAAGCYLGGETARGDSIMIRLGDGSGGAAVSGEMTVIIHEKDRRSGTLRGRFGADGVVLATFSFMQEGVTDSVPVQFTAQAGNPDTLLLRPSAYDPQSGSEYPDSSRGFSIRLGRVACGTMATGKFDRAVTPASSGR